METVEIEGKQYQVLSYAADGLPVVKGLATSVHHTNDKGELMYDEDGNPVRSVHVSVSPLQKPITEKEQ